MIQIYITAGAFAGWLFPEFMKLISPRKYSCGYTVNIMCSFIGGAFVHYILTH